MPTTLPLSTPLSMIRGQTKIWSLTVTDQDNNNAPVDLTGQYLKFIAKQYIQDPDNRAIFMIDSNSSNLVITNAANGIAQIQLDPVHTNSLAIAEVARYKWELNMYGNGESWPLNGGTLTIYADVSRIDTP